MVVGGYDQGKGHFFASTYKKELKVGLVYSTSHVHLTCTSCLTVVRL